MLCYERKVCFNGLEFISRHQIKFVSKNVPTLRLSSEFCCCFIKASSETEKKN